MRVLEEFQEVRGTSNVMANENLNDYLARQQIKWQFNLSRTPWWGGQFERLMGMMYGAIVLQ